METKKFITPNMSRLEKGEKKQEECPKTHPTKSTTPGPKTTNNKREQPEEPHLQKHKSQISHKLESKLVNLQPSLRTQDS